jgi:hypothetical protein
MTRITSSRGTQVGLGVQAVELARGDQREEVGSGLGVVVAPEEEPRLARGGDRANGALGAVVVKLQPTVFQEPFQRSGLVAGVAQRRRLVAPHPRHGQLRVDPREEGVHVRANEHIATGLARLGILAAGALRRGRRRRRGRRPGCTHQIRETSKRPPPTCGALDSRRRRDRDRRGSRRSVPCGTAPAGFPARPADRAARARPWRPSTGRRRGRRSLCARPRRWRRASRQRPRRSGSSCRGRA